MSKKKDAKSKSVTSNTVERTEWDDLDFEALEHTVAGLKESHQTVLRERIYAQTEHDAVHSYYNVTCNDFVNLDLATQRKDIQIEEKEKENEAELRIYDEKIKHLKYDHERNLDAAEKMKNQLLATESLNHEAQMIEEERRYERTRDELSERKVFHLEEINQLKIRKQEEIESMKSDLSSKIISLQEKCSLHEKGVEDELKVRRSADIGRMEEHRNLHLFQLDEQHKTQCNDTEQSCLEIEKDNTIKLKQLHDECKKVDKSITDCRDQCKKLDTENDQLSEPLSICLKKVKSLTMQVRDKEKNRASMRNVKARKIVLEGRQEQQMKEYKTLRQKFDSMLKETEDLRNDEKTSPQTVVKRRILDEIHSVETRFEDFENYLRRYPQVDIDDLKVKSSRVKLSLHKALKRLQT